MSKKNPEKFQQKQITDKKKDEEKKEIRKLEKLHTFISIMYYSDQVYLASVPLWIFLTVCPKKQDFWSKINIL